jgi:RNA methyltransferase, TrmH family
MKLITSRDNPLFRHTKALAGSSRERKKAGLALLEGAHLVAAYLSGHGSPRTVVVSESGQNKPELAMLLARSGSAERAVFVDALFSEVSTLDAPAGILALAAPPAPRLVPRDVSACLLLEDIQDPGNVGSILRSAAAAGVSHVLLSKNCAFAWAPKVLRAGQGAHFFLNIVEGADLSLFARDFKGQLLALSPRAQRTIFEVDMKRPTALIIGNEGGGLSGQIVSAASATASIPMPGGFESLNAAAAAAVSLFEMVRQRR